MSNIIDRRLNPRDKTIKNRQKFIQRSRDQIKRAVKDFIDTGNIGEIEDGKVRVKTRGISEPTFTPNPKSGNRKYVLPGNKEFVRGDTQDKQKEEDGSGGREGGLGRSEDDFEFELTQDEFADAIFDELELPDLIKKQLKDVIKVKQKRAGYTNQGNPSQLDIIRSLKNSLGRRLGLGRPKKEELETIEEQLEAAKKLGDTDEVERLADLLEKLRRRMVAVPWLDPVDVRYRAFTPQPQPMTQAVMFCIMDVSGSMGQTEKDFAKRFFFFLHMFLRRKYDKVDIIFVKHHEDAYEVSEDDFFYSKDSGGTVVSTALELTLKIIKERYPLADWNIYVAQASDGDNYSADRSATLDAMERLLPLAQYYAYVEVRPVTFSLGMTDLWKTYKALEDAYKNLAMRRVVSMPDIWKVFKELFSKEGHGG